MSGGEQKKWGNFRHAQPLSRDLDDGYTSESSASNSEEEDEWEDIVVAGDSKRCINAKPRGSDSQVLLWISDPFWFNDPDFRCNLRVSHSTFLRICELVAPTITDSINPCTGRVC